MARNDSENMVASCAESKTQKIPTTCIGETSGEYITQVQLALKSQTMTEQARDRSL